MTSRSPEGRQRRIRKLKARIASAAPDHMPRCTVPHPQTGKPCGRKTARAAKTGLSGFTCRNHQQHTQRHGSPWCPTPSAATLRPYLSAALSYIASHRADPFISAAIAGLEGLMASAGPVEIATRLRQTASGTPGQDRTRTATRGGHQARPLVGHHARHLSIG